MASKAPIHRSVVVRSEQSAAGRICERILRELKANDYNQDELFGIHLAIEEAFINAVKHGNKLDPGKEIKIEYSIMPDKVEIFITDEGNGFNPEQVSDPRLDENLYKSSGRGILLMRSYMDVVQYNQSGNCVHMVKYKAKNK